VVGAGAIALVQLGGIVVGHLLAAISAHDQAHRLFPPAEAVRTQVPMLGAMVALTVGAVGLVFGLSCQAAALPAVSPCRRVARARLCRVGRPC